MQRWLAEKRSMGRIPMALETFYAVCYMSGMIDFVAGLLNDDSTYRMTLCTGAHINLSLQDSSSCSSCQPYQHIASPVEMGLEISNGPGFRMTINAVSRSGVHRSGMGGTLPGYIACLHNFATATKARFCGVNSSSPNEGGKDKCSDRDDGDQTEGMQLRLSHSTCFCLVGYAAEPNR